MSVQKATGSPRRGLRYTPRGQALVFSWRHLRSRPLASSMTVLVLGITLALPFALGFLSPVLLELRGDGLEGESLTLYLERRISDLDGAALAETLAARPDVRATRYLSREDALQTLRERTDLDDAVALLDANPLPGAIVVYPHDDVIARGDVPALADAIGRDEAVESVAFDLRWVRRLQAALSLVRLVGSLLASFLLLTGLLVIANTVRLDLLRRSAEAEVVHLLGGGQRFRNRPFLYTGVLYGLLGGVVGVVLAVAMILALQGPAHELAGLYDSRFHLPIPGPLPLLTALAVAVMLGLVGAVSSLWYGSSDLFRRGGGG